MDLAAILAQLPALREEAERLKKDGRAMIERADRIENLIDAAAALRAPLPVAGSEELPDMPEPDPELVDQTSPRFKFEQVVLISWDDAILRILATEPLRAWSADEIRRAIEQKGWIVPPARDPHHNVQSWLSRMRKEGRVERAQRGLYVLPSEDPDGAGTESQPASYAGNGDSEAGVDARASTPPTQGWGEQVRQGAS